MDATSEPGFAGPEIPGYRLLGSMSRTPMSEVYRARELDWPGRIVALKVLPTFGARPASAERFRREIRIAKELSHPNIVEPTTRARPRITAMSRCASSKAATWANC